MDKQRLFLSLTLFAFGAGVAFLAVQEGKTRPPAAASSAATAPIWEEVTLEDKEYVTVRSLQKFYRFDSMEEQEGDLVLRKKGIELRFPQDRNEVLMNGVKYITSSPLVESDGLPLVDRIDLARIVDPVLRPDQITHEGLEVDTIIIDPGHGGHDPGTISPHGNGKEKDHALALAKNLSTRLRERGFKVELTRDSDTYLTLQQRINHANQHPNAVFIGLHFNSSGSERAQGIETFTLSGKENPSDRNGDEANHNTDATNLALATAVQSNVIKGTQRPDRGIRRARYSVLSGVKHPAILVEGGFLSHQTEGSYIAQSDYQDRLADSIAEGVAKFRTGIAQLR